MRTGLIRLSSFEKLIKETRHKKSIAFLIAIINAHTQREKENLNDARPHHTMFFYSQPIIKMTSFYLSIIFNFIRCKCCYFFQFRHNIEHCAKFDLLKAAKRKTKDSICLRLPWTDLELAWWVFQSTGKKIMILII